MEATGCANKLHRSPPLCVLGTCNEWYDLKIFLRSPFADNLVVDDDSLLLAAPISADFGTIKVSARRIEKVGHQDANRVRKGSGFQSVGTVHEQSKKAGAHCVGSVAY